MLTLSFSPDVRMYDCNPELRRDGAPSQRVISCECHAWRLLTLSIYLIWLCRMQCSNDNTIGSWTALMAKVVGTKFRLFRFKYWSKPVGKVSFCCKYPPLSVTSQDTLLDFTQTFDDREHRPRWTVAAGVWSCREFDRCFSGMSGWALRRWCK